MEPIAGEDHYLLARVQGGMRWYGAGFTVRDGKKYAAIPEEEPGNIRPLPDSL